MHGAVAAAALTWFSLSGLARVFGREARTAIALVSRVVPWRDHAGVATNALLAAWAAGGHPDAMKWMDDVGSQHGPEVLATGLGHRLVFAIESTGLLTGNSSQEVAASFLEAFFPNVR